MNQILSLEEAEDRETVGSKASSLARMSKMVRILQGFVVTNRAFRDFLEKNGLKDRILSVLSKIQVESQEEVEEASRKIGRFFDNSRISDDLKEDIEEAYKEFVISSEAKKAGEKAMELIKAGREKPAVVVRSSPRRNSDSFPGIYATKLNVKGDENLIKEVKEVWKSYYSPEAIYYREKKGYGHDAPFGVVVQKMVEADKTASFLETNPCNPNEFLLEGVYGLGEILSDGRANPDIYKFEKHTSDLKDKMIADKEWIQVRNPSNGEIEKQPVSSSKKNSEVFGREEMNELVKTGKDVSSHFPFDCLVEFCKRNGDVLLLDVSPIRCSEGEGNEGGESIAKGTPLSPGISTGEITSRDRDQQGKIVFGENPSVKSILFGDSAGLIANSGGYSSNSARMARELSKPMIVYKGPNRSSLREGNTVILDGFSGDIMMQMQKESSSPTLTGVSDTPEQGPLSNSITATEVIASVKGSEFEPGRMKKTDSVVLQLEDGNTFGGRYADSSVVRKGKGDVVEKITKFAGDVWIKTGSSDDLVSKISETLKRTQERGKGNGSPLFSVTSINELKSVEEKLDMTNGRKGVVIKTPVMALSAEELCSGGYDFVLIDYDELVNMMFGPGKESRDVLNADPFWEVVENISKKCREKNIEVGVSGNLDKKVLKRLVKSGVDSVLVSRESIDRVRNVLARVEKKLLLEKMR